MHMKKCHNTRITKLKHVKLDIEPKTIIPNNLIRFKGNLSNHKKRLLQTIFHLISHNSSNKYTDIILESKEEVSAWKVYKIVPQTIIRSINISNNLPKFEGNQASRSKLENNTVIPDRETTQYYVILPNSVLPKTSKTLIRPVHFSIFLFRAI